jgi:hypothetical protein
MQSLAPGEHPQERRCAPLPHLRHEKEDHRQDAEACSSADGDGGWMVLKAILSHQQAPSHPQHKNIDYFFARRDSSKKAHIIS